ncbi:hypothetical protein EHS25_000871 [Saitozyma podzolica]|uniref:Uncharacterized protein n=1 Tax=Saitozyma podzolica TaxID=1890683 RepID=A0A427YXH4_9TREE|nr:hypothetical protein EHS25_000871 [Saitozyma podzolica]
MDQEDFSLIRPVRQDQEQHALPVLATQRHVCPPHDKINFALVDHSFSDGVLFCSRRRETAPVSREAAALGLDDGQALKLKMAEAYGTVPS